MSSSPPSQSTDLSDDGDDDGPDTIQYSAYLYILVALAIIGIIVVCIWIRKKRKRATVLTFIDQSGVNALARDVENLIPQHHRHRWGPGYWRTGFPGVNRNDNGVDDLGEAPPPYSHADKQPAIYSRASSTEIDDALVRAQTEASNTAGPVNDIPLYTLQSQHPPSYYDLADGTTTRPGASPNTVNDIPARPSAAVTAIHRNETSIEEDMYRRASSRMRPTTTAWRDHRQPVGR